MIVIFEKEGENCGRDLYQRADFVFHQTHSGQFKAVKNRFNGVNDEFSDQDILELIRWSMEDGRV